MWLLKTSVAGIAATLWLLFAVSHVLLYDVKRNLAANEAHFWGCWRNMGYFFCGVDRTKRYLDCTVSSLTWAGEMSTLPINGKMSVNAHAYVVYNVTSALYCAINNYFCIYIQVSFVANSWLTCRWGRFTTNRVCMKTYTHIYVARTCDD